MPRKHYVASEEALLESEKSEWEAAGQASEFLPGWIVWSLRTRGVEPCNASEQTPNARSQSVEPVGLLMLVKYSNEVETLPSYSQTQSVTLCYVLSFWIVLCTTCYKVY